MNINLVRLKELKTISRHLDRIATCLEADLASRQIPLSIPPPDKEPPDILYTDEEADYVREMEEAIRRADGKLNPTVE